MSIFEGRSAVTSFSALWPAEVRGETTARRPGSFYTWYFYLWLSKRAVIFFSARQDATPEAEFKVCLATQRDCVQDLFSIISRIVQGWNEWSLSCQVLFLTVCCYIRISIFLLTQVFSFVFCKRQAKVGLGGVELWLWFDVRPRLSLDYRGHGWSQRLWSVAAGQRDWETKQEAWRFEGRFHLKAIPLSLGYRN